MVHNLRCETSQAQLQGFVVDGFFQEYAVVDYHNAVHLPKELDMKRTAPLFCAGITAFHAVDNCELRQGDWLAVIGCGGLGQYATQYAKAMGFKVVGIDINDEVLESVKRLGADATVNSRNAGAMVMRALQMCVSPPRSLSLSHPCAPSLACPRRLPGWLTVSDQRDERPKGPGVSLGPA